MGKTINFNYNDKEYTLEFTRKSIAKMEDRGFIASEISSKPMSTLPQLFAGAFLAHHPFEKVDIINEIYNLFPDKEALIGKLSDMYTDTFETLFDEPNPKNAIKWSASF
ncbi:MAG: DUF5055 domain-containing protein [Oscillospiraceae bacterium]